MKKLLSMLLVGLFTAVGSFASADTIDGFTSDSDIYKTSVSDIIYVSDLNKSNDFDDSQAYICVSSSPSPYTIYLDSLYPAENVSNSNVYCFSSSVDISNGGDEMGIFSVFDGYGNENNVFQNGNVYLSASPITYSSSAGGSENDSLLNPGVISSGVQNGVSAFTNGLGNLIPTLLLFGLPILVVVLFWNKVRSYLKRIFTRR